ncbi:glycosyltransferase family 2 protein [Xenorhabdus littoralis]|uniref:glycosyltransferase family 2 protein n=1 Tax=Xenorhabdus littoralis TaxID=2582835 RepID=UPI0029E7CD77|nr:glycosyltransferase family 2 protein [Xenorhabdus sp. psl]MDX7991997.1 glycosyltransferase family 2 protein [Xenorhabdus sp. psl]
MMSQKKINDTRSEYILSICIPTYNRSLYLKRLLESLVHQINDNNLPVEILISDNSSTDNTSFLCEDYSKKFGFVHYSKNLKNLGPDKNFAKVFYSARGRFVWVMGDDDDIIDNGLQKLIPLLLREQNSAIIYLEPKAISGDNKKRSNYKMGTNKELDFCIFNYNESFAKAVGIYFTFISSIIINKALYPITLPMMDKLVGTHLLQLSWIFQALQKGNKFIYVKKPFVIGEPDNSSGYNIFEVFSENLSRIAEHYFMNDPKILTSIKRASLYFVIPFMYDRQISKKISKNFSLNNGIDISNSVYKDIPEYHYFFKHVLKIPYLGITTCYAIRFFRKVLKYIRRCFY